MSDIITCPNCGANSNNRKNCEYCGSLLVRLTRAGFDHSKLTNFEEANIYPGLQEALEKHKQESICKPEKCTITTIRDRAKESSSVSKAAKALFTQTVTTDPIQLVIVNSRQAKGDDGLYLFPKAENGDLTFIFDESDNTQDPAIISRFCDSELNNLFTLYNGLYFIDFGSDTKGAARLLSKLLYEVYKVPKLTNLQYDTTDVKDVKDYRSKRYKSLKILVTVSACIFTLICYLPKIYHTYSKHTKRLEERREYTDARENNYSYNSNTYEYTNAANNTPEEPVQPAMEIELASSSLSSIQMKDDADFCEFKYDSNGNMKEIYSEEAGHGLELKTIDFHGKNQLLIDNDDIIEDDNTKTKIRINNGRVSTAENVASIPSWVSPVYYNWNNEGDLASIAHGNSDEKVVNVEYDKTKQNLLNVDFTLFVMSRHLMSTAFPIVLLDGNVSKPSKHLPIKITVDDLGTMHGGQTIYKLQWRFDSQNRPTSVSVKKKSVTPSGPSEEGYDSTYSETLEYTYIFKYK